MKSKTIAKIRDYSEKEKGESIYVSRQVSRSVAGGYLFNSCGMKNTCLVRFLFITCLTLFYLVIISLKDLNHSGIISIEE